MHVSQALEDLIRDFTGGRLGNRGVSRHVSLKSATREILHGDEERVILRIPPKQLNEASGILQCPKSTVLALPRVSQSRHGTHALLGELGDGF